ncbi:hypothetical protein [Iodobacter fluviatilis]|uniref:Uncharacterized protein n=1 Tax=Iodobacter fluviatilis TaxID=537 RepID=A0A7G3GB12_9NEIS|nr:hypothetical protein [Iodobacter fluviatilis]QBC44436.1 hypothetical protein C1H71_13455 [Iodobacter fluviatilis]
MSTKKPAMAGEELEMIPVCYQQACWTCTTATDAQGQVGIGLKTADGIIHRFLLNAENAHHLSTTLNAQAQRHAPSEEDQKSVALGVIQQEQRPGGLLYGR